jgi:hypothetical protein
MDSWFFLPFPRAVLDLWNRGSGRGEEPGGAKGLRLIQIRFSDAEFGKNAANLSNQFAASSNRRFQFHKRSQLLLRTHNETLPVVTMCVCNPERSPASMIPLPKCRTIQPFNRFPRERGLEIDCKMQSNYR